MKRLKTKKKVLLLKERERKKMFDDEDMCCTKCTWTHMTGGMTYEDHASCGHGPLVPRSKLAESKPKRCVDCGIQETEKETSSCKYHPGEKQNLTITAAGMSSDVKFTWSCRGAKYDYREPARIVFTELGENIHQDGCKTKTEHRFELNRSTYGVSYNTNRK